MSKKIPMTTEGAIKLKEELERLKRVERRAVIEAISEARAHGDLKENAEYHAAKEKQSFIEGRIIELESKLGNAHVIDVTSMTNNGTVIFGCTVELVNEDTSERVIYQIVGEDEADIKLGKISFSSPIARGVIGKEEGDIVEVKTPTGTISYEIDVVSYT